MPYQPPLHIHLLFHPDSEKARELAESLVPGLMAGPVTRGLRVPVFLVPDQGDGLPPSLDAGNPDRLNLDSAQHTVVLVLADARMQQRVDGGTGEQWADFVKALIDSHDRTKHQILLVALDANGLQLDDALANLNFIVLGEDDDNESRKMRVAFHLGVRSLMLLRESEIPENEVLAKPPVKLFLSHAKADLDKDRKSPVHRLLEETAVLPIDNWYDARKIDPGVEFTARIKDGIRDADLMVVFLTDSWAKSEWCRMEAMYAKEVDTPILVVDALVDGEPRSFPYLGNVRTLRWRCALGDTQVGAADHEQEEKQGRQREATRLIGTAIQETLRRLHSLALMKGQARQGDVPLSTAPESTHLAFHPTANSFLYPDPPLSAEEYKLLNAIRPDASFDTPLIRVARRLNLKEPLMIAVSVSDSEALARYGLLDQHCRTITDEIHLYLLVAGLRIAYGGKLDPDALDDPDNFTLRLFNLVSGYKGLANRIGTKLAPILNVAPWPLWHLYNDEVYKQFGTIAELYKMPRPDLGMPEADLDALPEGFVPPDTPMHQYVWGPAMTAMRMKMTTESFARVSIGGKIEGYKGRCAGLIEEPLLSLRQGKPLFLVGALGGCTRLVIDLLEQRDRSEMNTDVARKNVPNYDQLAALYGKYAQEFKTREELAHEISVFGTEGPANALKNGLNDDDNRELFACVEPRRIAELILTGIAKLNE